MRLLLDTNVVLWHMSGERALSQDAIEAIEAATELLVSVVTYAEIGIKMAVGKLEVPVDIDDRLASLGVRTLALSARHGLAVADLPVHHRDPFDRLLIAQAAQERLCVVTGDARFHEYEIDVVSA
jgi:PIN domain nuclease of toxin-antitoxin system